MSTKLKLLACAVFAALSTTLIAMPASATTAPQEECVIGPGGVIYCF
ncbi:hypothetical protein LWC34_19770 [Kibdelosporangium philippinense]|uniref:Porin n=1 Tax=Kibdelosporangium philippinense TaxID=211113 RepID=A0ABS8ZCV4_9PSEU|nr:hypothetical protein [Kibdelosporangium philippinense]MCE7005049.1 hypothetical protein [Kibdelosporangium philippinense]